MKRINIYEEGRNYQIEFLNKGKYNCIIKTYLYKDLYDEVKSQGILEKDFNFSLRKTPIFDDDDRNIVYVFSFYGYKCVENYNYLGGTNRVIKLESLPEGEDGYFSVSKLVYE